MYRAYKYTRMINGESEQDLIILFYPKDIDLGRTLHKLGLEYCINQNGGRVPIDGLSFDQLMDNITLEMLSPYGMSMIRPNDIAIQADNTAPVIGPYELETYQESINNGYYQVKKVCKTAERIARRLESQRRHDHPVVSTWAPDIISTKAIVWADQFVNGNEPDFVKFFEKKLQEAKPHSNDKDQPPVDTGTSNDAPDGQCTEQISQ